MTSITKDALAQYNMIDVDMEIIDDHNYILFLIAHHLKLIAIMDILNIVTFSPCK